MTHHTLDPYPIPKDKSPLYVNEITLADKSLLYTECFETKNEKEKDNIRIYVPLDLNKKAILRRLQVIIYSYGEANEKNAYRSAEKIICFDRRKEICYTATVLWRSTQVAEGSGFEHQ